MKCDVSGFRMRYNDTITLVFYTVPRLAKTDKLRKKNEYKPISAE